MGFGRMGRAISWIWTMGLLAASVGATVHKVGDSAGWTSLGSVDYAKWATSNTFHVGDTVVFSYNNNFHNVLQVNQEQYKSCNSSSPAASYNSGADSITLKRPGTFYFLCGFPGHCQMGQKVEIKVNPGSSSSGPSPSPSPLPNGPATLGSPSASAPTPSAAASSTLSYLSLLCLHLALAAFYSFSLCV